MEHAVLVYTEHLPQGASPLYSVDPTVKSIPVVFEHGSIGSIQNGNGSIRLDIFEIVTTTKEEMYEAFCSKVKCLAKLAGYAGIVIAAIRTDFIMNTNGSRILQLGMMYVPWSDAELRSCKGMVLDGDQFPTHINMNEDEEDLKNFFHVMEIMDC